MNIIFLDIDGVLNSQEYVLKVQELFDIPEHQIDPLAVIRLNRLTDLSNASIVITSTWRMAFIGHLDLFQKFLIERGITGKVIGMTEVTHGDRADEIWDWIDEHKSIIDNYVILDDDRLESKRDSSDPVLDMHFVRTSWSVGLQDKHVDVALKILGVPIGQEGAPYV